MKARIVVQDDGKITFFTDTGTFAEGKAVTDKILVALGAAGIEFTAVGDAEQHRHEKAHEADHAHNRAHTHE